MLLVVLGMIGAGLQGVPRRHWDVTFSSSPFNIALPAASQVFLAILGIGAIIAIVGGVMYLAVVLVSVFTGERREANRLTLVASQANPLVEHAIPNAGKEAEGELAPRGALTIVFIFLAFFALYYLSNWWLLGRTWFIR
ncbi:MAG: hypothetical protein D6775_08970 [Caldilineae bacterium]|nr:MAG: hypothetical protein D6775_08970 [Caldilineae bacterium]